MITKELNRISFKELILHQDSDYIFINKPPFLSSLADRNHPVNLLELARKEYPGIQVGHRLDKETSGIMALAKNPEAYRHLALQFEARTVIKDYQALVPGIHQLKEHQVRAPIRTLAKGIVVLDKFQGKEAVTVFNTIAVYKKHSLISCRPLTGRMHQIRVHLASLDAPIIGDTTYGGAPFYLSEIKKHYNLKRNSAEQPLIQRVALHAHYLEFISLSGAPLGCEAPHPKDFKVLIRQLEKHL